MVAGGILGTLLVTTCIICCCCHCKRKSRERKRGEEEEEECAEVRSENSGLRRSEDSGLGGDYEEGRQKVSAVAVAYPEANTNTY